MSKRRFIASVIKTAQADAAQMPWARGARRQSFINKRRTLNALARKSA